MLRNQGRFKQTSDFHRAVVFKFDRRNRMYGFQFESKWMLFSGDGSPKRLPEAR
jgi:hypothetical protein